MYKVLTALFLGLTLVGCNHVKTGSEIADIMMKETGKDEVAKEGVSMKEKEMGTKYQAYSTELLSELKGVQPFIIFFYADWCPTCRHWESVVKESLGDLPENTVILKANYDTEEELKKEYGISVQSTAVFVDGEGNVVKTVGDPSMEDVTAHFQS